MSNLTWHTHTISKKDREKLNGHKGALIWFFGLSGSGKSTLAGLVEEALHQKNVRTYLLDGDNVRHGLCKDLGFSKEDRNENLRRVAEAAKLQVDAGLVVLASFVSPFEEGRQIVKSIFKDHPNFWIHVDTTLEECEKRDPKGLYKKAREGSIPNFTGISSPFEEMPGVDLKVDGNKEPNPQEIFQFLIEKNII